MIERGTHARWVVLALASLSSCGAAAGVAPVEASRTAAPPFTTRHGFSIPGAHPRLWWTPARLAQARSWLAAHPFRPAATDYFHIAWKHAVAGTDCSPAIAWAMKRQVPAAQYSPRGIGSDIARWHGEDAIVVYDWCHDQLTPAQRRAFLEDLGGSGKGWNDYLNGINQQQWGGPGMTQSNYNWGNLRNALELGIASYGENTAAAEAFLTDALVTRWANNFVPSASEGGAGAVGQEGSGYAATMLQYPIVPFVSMKLGGRDVFDETDYFKQSVFWVVYGTTPAPTYGAGTRSASYQLNPFSDDEHFREGGILARRAYFQNFMTFAAGQWRGIDVGKYARRWVETVGAHASVAPASPFIRAQDGGSEARAFGALPLDYYAKGIQYLYGRTAWDGASTWFLWQMGRPRDGGGHAHADVGNFNIWRGGRWLTRETTGYSDRIAGYGHRERAVDEAGSAIAHNTIVFGTALYKDGVKLMPSVDAGQAVVRRLESRPEYVYAAVDTTPRYRWGSDFAHFETGAVVHVERELLFLRRLEATVVLDRVTTGDVTRGADSGKPARDQVATFVVHFETAPTLEDANHLTAVNGTQALRMTTLVPSSPARRVIDERACAGCSRAGQWRVELDAAGAAQRYFLHVLQGRDAGGGDLAASVVDSDPADPALGTFTVTLRPAGGPATTVVFEKGRTSRGGTVNVAGAGAGALASGVQEIRYTDAGPQWATTDAAEGRPPDGSGGARRTSRERSPR